MVTESFIKNILHGFEVADEKVAFDIYDGVSVTSITYRQFLSDILTCAGYFVENTIMRQHIALAAPNSYEWIVAFYAILASGNIIVPMNPNLSDELLLKEMTQVDISLICGDISLAEKACCINIPFVNLDRLAGSTPVLLDCVTCVADNETMMLIFTSGTTGKSKVAEFAPTNIQAMLNGQALAFASEQYQKELLVFPLFHIGGINVAVNTLNQGMSLCLGRGPAYLFNDMHIMNPTHIAIVPSILDSAMKALRNVDWQEVPDYLGNSLRKISVGAASVNVNAIKFFQEHGVIIEGCYSMSEACGLGLRCEIDVNYSNRIGRPSCNMECRIQNGEILLKSESVMKGYYKDPGETAKVIEDGWLHTGDLGYCDEQGNYYITGRKKNTIILSNGENVNPEEIEAAWGQCEAIQECLVYSDGKGICADVYAGDQEKAAQFIKEYNERVPRYHQVYKVFYSETPLEKTSSGKLKRKDNKA